MYLELVKQVSQVEQETEASVRQAAQQAQQMQEEAERSGRALVEQTRRDLQQLETQRRRQAAEDAGGSLHLCRSGGGRFRQTVTPCGSRPGPRCLRR